MILTQKHLDSFVDDTAKRALDVYYLALCSGDNAGADAEIKLIAGLQLLESAHVRLQKLVEVKK